MRHPNRIKTSYTRTVEWVPIDAVEFHPEYCQRPFNLARAKALLEKFDIDDLGFPFVAELTLPGRSKPCFVGLDCQHRFWAARQYLGPGQMIECEVARGLTVSEAAIRFVRRNDSMHVKPFNKFINKVRGGDPIAVAIKKLVEGFNLTISDASGGGYISCVSALERVYTMPDGPARLKRALQVYTNGWGTSQGVVGDVLSGLVLFLAYYPEVEDDSLVKRLAGLAAGATNMLGRGRTLKLARGGTLPNAIAESFHAVYNLGRRTKLLVPWSERTTKTVRKVTDEEVLHAKAS